MTLHRTHLDTASPAHAPATDPRRVAAAIERGAFVPDGAGDRFTGYAVIGQPFRSGHVLALRRFPANSLGAPYTSVWHRDPAGHWTFYQDVEPCASCSRYFGAAVRENVTGEIRLAWPAPNTLRVSTAAGGGLEWTLELSSTPATRLLGGLGDALPEGWWRRPPVLAAMGTVARVALGTGRLRLTGRTPNGHRFIANPRRLWVVTASRARVGGVDLGTPGPLPEQATLGEFRIPQRGLFAVASAFLDGGAAGADCTLPLRRAAGEGRPAPRHRDARTASARAAAGTAPTRR